MLGPFDRWYDVAGVRAGVRRKFHDETEQGKVFFPQDLIPYLTHDAVRSLPPARLRELTIRHLYQFLLSTTHLEMRIVNRAAERIANNRVGLQLPLSVRLDAFKVYCDEGYHALYSLDLADQIAAATQIPLPLWDYGACVDRLEDTRNHRLPDQPVLAELLQVIIFETLITAALNELPNNATVITTVRELMHDHARDEGRHHRFFSALFHELWAHLEPSLRVRVVQVIPVLIHDCLGWDIEPVRSSLMLAGLDEPTVDLVIHDCYGGNTGAQRSGEIARGTIKMCESAGVFDIPGSREAFAAYRLDEPVRSSPREAGSLKTLITGDRR
jgi:hypothetical protein